MIGISGLGWARPVRGDRTGARGGAGGFEMPSAPAVQAGSSGSIGAIGLVGLQEDDRPQVKDRAARRGGERVLEALDRLRRAALDGGMGDAGHEAAALDRAVGQMSEAHDPVLRGLIGAIRLRARVELARCLPM